MSKTNGKSRKLRFSVIDLVIVLITVVLIVGVCARYDIVTRLFSKTSLTEAKVTFIAEAITEDEAEVFDEQTKFYLEGSVFGTLSTVSNPSNALIYVENENGELIAVEDNSLFDLEGTFICKVLRGEDNSFLLDGNRYIAAGSVFTVRANGVAVKITITGVQEKN